MVSSGVWVRMLRRIGRLLMTEPLFAALASHFLKFRRRYRERDKAVFSA